MTLLWLKRRERHDCAWIDDDPRRVPFDQLTVCGSPIGEPVPGVSKQPYCDNHLERSQGLAAGTIARLRRETSKAGVAA